jgi:hypothetical protein
MSRAPMVVVEFVRSFGSGFCQGVKVGDSVVVGGGCRGLRVVLFEGVG